MDATPAILNSEGEGFEAYSIHAISFDSENGKQETRQLFTLAIAYAIIARIR